MPADRYQLPTPTVQHRPLDSLTACIEDTEQPALAKAIYRLLFELGLEVVRVQGCPTRPDVVVFHLPQEMLAAHLSVHRTTIWRNLQTFLECGVLATEDHYDTLRGQNVVTGKLWAVSLYPERVLSGQAAPVRLTRADFAFHWRTIEEDARTGRTSWELTRTDEQRAAYKAEQEARAEERAAARARAEARAAERKAARARGEKVPTGRRAATENAATTRREKGRAEKPRPTRPKPAAQQSVKGLKAVEREALEKWVLAPFFSSADLSNDVTLTVAGGVLSGRDAIFTLPALAALPKAQRGAAVEEAARAMSRAFEDTKNLRFWCWLVWQTLRAYDQGQDLCDDLMFVLSRVLADMKHDESMSARTLISPGAAAVNLLRKCGLLDRLREVKPYRVGARPKAASAY